MRTGEKQGKVLNILNKIPVLILIPFLICISAIALFKRAEYCAYKYKDNPAWVNEKTTLLLLTLGIIFGVLLLIVRIGEKLERHSRKQVVRMILYLSVVLQVFVILYLPAKQFADQNTVNSIALNMINGNYSAFRKGGYLYQYPNNVGITVLLSLIYRVFPNTLLVPKLLNVIFSTTTSFLIFRIYEETFGTEKSKGYGILILSGFFLPMLLLNNLVYNDIMATTLFAGVVYYAILFTKTRRLSHMTMVGTLIVAGNFLRQVGVIMLIATTLYFIIRKLKIVKALVFFVIVLILCELPLNIVNGYFLAQGRIKEKIGENSIPIHMWINIGMNDKKIGYWDNSYSYNVYVREGSWNKAKSTKIYQSMIKKNIEERGYLDILLVYLKKNIWLWTEGTYQAEYYGIGSWGYLYPTYISELLQDNTTVRDFTRWTLHSTNLLMLGLIAAGLIESLAKKHQYPLVLAAIVLLGFIGFYTIWEIKPRYIYLTYPYIILMAYYGIQLINERLKHFRERLSDDSDTKAIENR